MFSLLLTTVYLKYNGAAVTEKTERSSIDHYMVSCKEHVVGLHLCCHQGIFTYKKNDNSKDFISPNYFNQTSFITCKDPPFSYDFTINGQSIKPDSLSSHHFHLYMIFSPLSFLGHFISFHLVMSKTILSLHYSS